MSSSILFFGTECDFASTVLDRLIHDGHEIRAFITPGSSDETEAISELSSRPRTIPLSTFPISSPQVAGHDAGRRNLPGTQRLSLYHPIRDEAAQLLAGFNADFAVVCCYPRKIPLEILASTKYGGLNVHPSWLPRYRGPDPLFWIYRNGERETGVSIHRVEHELDSGAILQQQRIEIPVGLPGDVLWAQCAELGGRLLSEVIESIVLGRAVPQPQDDSGATYFTWPSASDLALRPDQWQAWSLFHFCRGVVPLGYVPILAEPRSVRRIKAAFEYVANTHREPAPASNGEWVECADGWVLFELGPAIF